MNKHLHDIMDGLTAKVFRTYNASRTLEEQLEKQMNGIRVIASTSQYYTVLLYVLFIAFLQLHIYIYIS